LRWHWAWSSANAWGTATNVAVLRAIAITADTAAFLMVGSFKQPSCPDFGLVCLIGRHASELPGSEVEDSYHFQSGTPIRNETRKATLPSWIPEGKLKIVSLAAIQKHSHRISGNSTLKP
jgi:hypothetical protein